MAQMIQAVRGMNDILPSDTVLWQKAEQIIRETFQGHGFQEIRFPIVEKTELFKRSIGEVTDIVEKEMYTFLDRNNESLTLRPEGTAVCVRAGLEHGIIFNQIQHLWYMGPYFRYEKPQKGRYRQFHQCAAEVFGLTGPDIDATVIMMTATLLNKLGIGDVCTLQINTLGTTESRKVYRDKLVQYFRDHESALDADSLIRLEKNPLRILDSKNERMRDLINNAPKLTDFLDDESKQHFTTLQYYLKTAGIKFVINHQLVRGLDYYTKTVFEWVTDQLGAQGTVCAGGRYDGLVEQLGGRPTPAMGFAAGLERIILIMEQLVATAPQIVAPHVYFITDSPESFAYGLKIADTVRQEIPEIRILMHCGGGSFKNQFKKADKSGARFALVLGEEELKTDAIVFKNLREEAPQQLLPQKALVGLLREKISNR